MTETKRRRFRVGRDTALFAVGLGGIIHEILVSGFDRPALLALLGGMVGLPTMLRRDEKTQETTP